MTQVLTADQLYRFHQVEGHQIPILKGISFGVAAAEFVTIMGPSGSGKSTLLHILAGLDQASAGSVLLGETDLGSLNEEDRTRLRRERIGFIFQFFNLLPDLTVRENVFLPLLIAGKDPRRHEPQIQDLLEMLGLQALSNRLPHRLSGGEMQRVSIARALVMEPKLLLADEPTGNLSSKAGEEIVHWLKEIAQRRHTSVLLVTHNPRDAAVGDRVLFLHDGQMDAARTLVAANAPGGKLSAADVFRRLEELGI